MSISTENVKNEQTAATAKLSQASSVHTSAVSARQSRWTHATQPEVRPAYVTTRKMCAWLFAGSSRT